MALDNGGMSESMSDHLYRESIERTFAAQAQELAEAREVLQRLVDASTYEGLPNYQSVLLEAKVYLSRTEAKV